MKTKPTAKKTAPPPKAAMPALKHWKALLSCLFAVAVFLFFYLGQTHVLIYHEWTQMFQFTDAYFLDRIVVPGGLARYLGEFLSQFFRTPWLGAVIMSLLVAAVQWLGWAVARRDGAGEVVFALSFVPALVLLYFLGDADVQVSYPVAMVAALASCLLFRPSWKSALAMMPFVVVFYLLFGTTVYIIVLYEVMALIVTGIRTNQLAKTLIVAVLLAAFAVAVVWVSTFYTPYPFARIFKGIPYYSFSNIVPPLQIHTMWITAVVLAVMTLLPRWKVNAIIVALIAVVIVAIGMKMSAAKYDSDINYLIKYDSLVYTEQWDTILKMDDTVNRSSTMSVACCDLALALRGQLADNLFNYPQMGPEGLFIFMQSDNLSLNLLGEIFLNMGMVNEAQRFYYDSQESQYNTNKCSRLMKRLTEIEIINGQYDVARKYLNQLATTLYYRDWANEQLLLLGNEDAVNNHPFYGRLRSLRPKEDYIFQPNSKFYTIKDLYDYNPENYVAEQYLKAVVAMKQNSMRR